MSPPCTHTSKRFASTAIFLGSQFLSLVWSLSAPQPFLSAVTICFCLTHTHATPFFSCFLSFSSPRVVWLLTLGSSLLLFSLFPSLLSHRCVSLQSLLPPFQPCVAHWLFLLSLSSLTLYQRRQSIASCSLHAPHSCSCVCFPSVFRAFFYS